MLPEGYGHIALPHNQGYLHDGDIIKLGRFKKEKWKLSYGWYEFGGNRPFCGWYLTSQDSTHIVRPLQKPDLVDIVFIENGGTNI